MRVSEIPSFIFVPKMYNWFKHMYNMTCMYVSSEFQAIEQANEKPGEKSRSFDCYLYQCFDGKPPGSYHLTRPMTVSGTQTFLKTKANIRARDSFEYWPKLKDYPVTECMSLLHDKLSTKIRVRPCSFLSLDRLLSTFVVKH